MKTSIKFLVPAALAGLVGVLAGAQPAEALSCGTNNVAWTTLGKCAAPNANRGSLQGGGLINTNDRDLFLVVAPGAGNVSGTGRGLNSSFNPASGPNGSCVITRSAGQNGFTPDGTCNNGTVHRLTITFN